MALGEADAGRGAKGDERFRLSDLMKSAVRGAPGRAGNERLRLSDLIETPCAGGGTGDTSSSRRCPPCGSALAIWCIEQFEHTVKKQPCTSGPSRGLVESAETCEKVPVRELFRPYGSDRNAHIKGRADVKRKKQLYCRAHIEIQTHMPPNHTTENHSGCIHIVRLCVIQNKSREVQPPTHICAFCSRP